MKTTIAIISILLLTACAGHRPIIDSKGVDMVAYEQDLKECQAYAGQVSPGKTAAIGGLIGAGIGATVGVIIGVALNSHRLAGRLAVAGAALGGMRGATEGAAAGGGSQVAIINECMTGRGYHVLLMR